MTSKKSESTQSLCESINGSDPRYAPANCRFVTTSSVNLGGRGDILIYNPDAAGPNAPVIVLLHGMHGSFWQWMYSAGVHETYETLRQSSALSEFVLAMPSDGLFKGGSAYLNLEAGAFEAWTMEDVPAVLRHSCSNVTASSRLYLCGLSMGGYGALRLGAKYADRVAAISAHSAVTQTADLNRLAGRALLADFLDPPEEAEITYWLFAHRAKLPKIRFDCGTDDSLFGSNRALSKWLDTVGIKHDFAEYPGGHTWDYWTGHVAESLLFFDTVEKRDTS